VRTSSLWSTSENSSTIMAKNNCQITKDVNLQFLGHIRPDHYSIGMEHTTRQMDFVGGTKLETNKSKMADGRRFGNAKISVSQPVLGCFAPNLVCGFRLSMKSLLLAENGVRNSRWRRPLSWILFFFGHISVADEDICAKFGSQMGIRYYGGYCGPKCNFR